MLWRNTNNLLRYHTELNTYRVRFVVVIVGSLVSGCFLFVCLLLLIVLKKPSNASEGQFSWEIYCTHQSTSIAPTNRPHHFSIECGWKAFRLRSQGASPQTLLVLIVSAVTSVKRPPTELIISWLEHVSIDFPVLVSSCEKLIC